MGGHRGRWLRQERATAVPQIWADNRICLCQWHWLLCSSFFSTLIASCSPLAVSFRLVVLLFVLFFCFFLFSFFYPPPVIPISFHEHIALSASALARTLLPRRRCPKTRRILPACHRWRALPGPCSRRFDVT